MKLLIIFTVFNFINVIISTIKSIVTVNGSKAMASLVNAIGYGYYTIIIYLVATVNISVITKSIIVFFCNLTGVYIVKAIEKKYTSNKLWIFNCTIYSNVKDVCKFQRLLEDNGIKSLYHEVIKDEIYNIEVYSKSTETSKHIIKTIHDLEKDVNIKYYIIESKGK